MFTYIPYTYLIGWTNHNKWYYGVRFAKNCSPSELWRTYFTSSTHVKEFRKQYGEPDVIEIRKTFVDSLKAKTWEHKVLKKLNVINEEKWLNQNHNMFPFNTKNKDYMKTPEYKEKMRLAKLGSTPWNKGKKGLQTQSAERRLQVSQQMKGNTHLKGFKHSEETKRKMSESHRKC